MGRNLFVFVIISVIASLFLTIEWFTIWAWIALSIILTAGYDLYFTSQENNVKLVSVLLEKMDKLGQQCTRMSTIMSEVRDNINRKKKFDTSKLKKHYGTEEG